MTSATPLSCYEFYSNNVLVEWVEQKCAGRSKIKRALPGAREEPRAPSKSSEGQNSVGEWRSGTSALTGLKEI